MAPGFCNARAETFPCTQGNRQGSVLVPPTPAVPPYRRSKGEINAELSAAIDVTALCAVLMLSLTGLTSRGMLNRFEGVTLWPWTTYGCASVGKGRERKAMTFAC